MIHVASSEPLPTFSDGRYTLCGRRIADQNSGGSAGRFWSLVSRAPKLRCSASILDKVDAESRHMGDHTFKEIIARRFVFV